MSYAEPVDESYIHPSRWLDAFYQITISRQSDLQAMLLEFPTDVMRQSSTRCEEAAYQEVDMHRAIWAEPHFTQNPAFAAMEEWAAHLPPRSVQGKAVKMLTVPYFEVLRQMEQGDSDGLNRALTDALLAHQKYWSAPVNHRENFHGFVSMQLTAAAALSWDRGLRFDVESDYMPTSWVRGDVFRQP